MEEREFQKGKSPGRFWGRRECGAFAKVKDCQEAGETGTQWASSSKLCWFHQTVDCLLRASKATEDFRQCWEESGGDGLDLHFKNITQKWGIKIPLGRITREMEKFSFI